MSSGRQAVDELGADLADVAEDYGLSAKQLRNLAPIGFGRVDRQCGDEGVGVVGCVVGEGVPEPRVSGGGV